MVLSLEITNLRQILFAMKKALILLMIGCASYAASAQISVSNERIEAVITPDTQRMELWEMSQALDQHGIVMRYDRINYTADWKLTAINLGVKFGEGEFISFFTGDLMGDGQVKIVVKPLDATDQVCVSTECE